MPDAVNSGIGFRFPLLGPMCGLGPYLNLFPIITLSLFLIQQKVMMPPAADEQAAQQQKIMKYVMVLMGLMFFKVAAGLCIYFIASTLWGLAERQFLPKTAPASGNSGDDDDPPSALRRKSTPQQCRAQSHSPQETRGEEVAGRRLATSYLFAGAFMPHSRDAVMGPSFRTGPSRITSSDHSRPPPRREPGPPPDALAHRRAKMLSRP